MPPIIRTATATEVATLIDWAAAEGWNPGIGDAEAFHRADPGGFRVADVDGALAAGIALVRYGESYAFLGLYIAAPEFRGQGIGYALWQDVIAGAGSRTIGLDGVVAQQENYRTSGFALAHTNIRYGGTPTVPAATSADLADVQRLHVPMIVDYDRALNPARRETFLTEWLKDSGGRQSVALLRAGKITGYGTVRRCREGYKIGPLFSDTETGADLLFRRLVSLTDGGPVFLDVPEPNAAAKALASRYNLKSVFETARMYRGIDPDLPLDRIYGITSFELG
ncbi:hypothetical protein SAMN05880582_10193 [Rhizobium sp. RU20A]|uniref:GNAT family N-acetyltransferase n=1 Tax=Rhizobium sp. RU20A TaxID=1907412 RepID=UPI00095504EA|nr:GNAT family N-acetyltransferase [Rhizobium sp. RU20A]SIP93930.1 hypothetical protein SAMN05880582_10193 [Rhizobium sp. RU20A]